MIVTAKVKVCGNDVEPGEFTSGGSPPDPEAPEPWRLEQDDEGLQKTLRSWHPSLSLEAFQPESEVQEERVAPGSVHCTDAEKGDWHLQVVLLRPLRPQLQIQNTTTNTISNTKCRLSYLAHLDLCDNDLSSLCPKLLARTVNTVEDCDIGYTDLTPEQVHWKEHNFSSGVNSG